MSDTPFPASPSGPGRAPRAIPPTWLLSALVLVLLGVLVQATPLNRAWMLWAHGLALLPDVIWAGLTLLAFGWSALILVSAADRGVQGGRAVLLGFLLGGLLAQVLKVLLAMPRPGLVLPAGALHFIGNPVLNSGSMPSGHALAAFTIGSLWVCLLRQRGASPWLEATAWAMAALMAGSRIAVGAHWPSDVLVGSGLGLAIGWLSWQAQARWLRRGGWMSPGIPLAVELLAAFAAFTAREGYPQVLGLQWLLGAVALASAGWRLFGCWSQRQESRA